MARARSGRNATETRRERAASDNENTGSRARREAAIRGRGIAAENRRRGEQSRKDR